MRISRHRDIMITIEKKLASVRSPGTWTRPLESPGAQRSQSPISSSPRQRPEDHLEEIALHSCSLLRCRRSTLHHGADAHGAARG